MCSLDLIIFWTKLSIAQILQYDNKFKVNTALINSDSHFIYSKSDHRSDLLPELSYGGGKIFFGVLVDSRVVHCCCTQSTFFYDIEKYGCWQVQNFLGEALQNLFFRSREVVKALLEHSKMSDNVLEFWGRKGRMVRGQPFLDNGLDTLLLNNRGNCLFFFAILFRCFLSKPASTEISSWKVELFCYGFGDHYNQNYLYIQSKVSCWVYQVS